MESLYFSDDLMPYECPQFFTEEKVEEDRNPLMELFPDILAMSLNTLDHYSDPQLELFGGLVTEPDLPFVITEPSIEKTIQDIEIRQEPKKRGRPRKTEKNSAGPNRKRMPSTEIIEKKKKKRKCMTQVEKAQHNHLERERRKGMSLLLEQLRELVPAVSEDSKASQKKIVDEATAYLQKEKAVFLSFLKEKQRFFQLDSIRRGLEQELSCKPEVGTARTEESIEEEEWVNEAIRLLELSPQNSEEDSADEEDINVEV